jgi:hypothetical protein
VEFGASYINDGQQDSGGELAGIDIRWQAGDATVIRAEVAESNTQVSGSELNGHAQALSIEHQGEIVDVRAFYKEVDQDFGLGQQSTAEKGIRSYGVDGRVELNEVVSINALASSQKNLQTGATRHVADADFAYQNQDLSANLGLVYAEDEFISGDSRSSSLVDGGISQRWLGSALTVRANGSFILESR